MPNVRRAFSLIELLVVLTIIAIIMALTLPSLSKARDSAEFLTWSSYSRGLQMDPDLVLYWTFENQNVSDNFVANQTAGGGYSMAPFGLDDLLVETALNIEQPEFSFAPPSSSQTFDILQIAKKTWAASDFTLKILEAGEPLDPRRPAYVTAAAPTWTRGRWQKKSAIAFGGEGSPVNPGYGLLTAMRAPHHDDLNLMGEPFTLWCWVRSENGRVGTILSKIDLPTRTGYMLRFYQHPSGHDSIRLMFMQGGFIMGAHGYSLNHEIGPDDWIFFAAVSDGNTLTAHVNGRNFYPFTTTGLPSFDNESDLIVGAAAAYGPPFWGDIDELGIAKRAMSEQELIDMYNAGRTTTYGGKK